MSDSSGAERGNGSGRGSCDDRGGHFQKRWQRDSASGPCGPGGGRGGGSGSGVGGPLADKEKTLEEMSERTRQMENTPKERDQRLQEIEKAIRAKDAELESTKASLDNTKRSLEVKERAVAERDDQLRGLARRFRERSGYPESDVEQWVEFVQVVAQSRDVRYDGPRTGQDQTWTIVQQWGSDIVKLNSIQNQTTEGLLVRLYGKVVTEGMDDETVDSVRSLILDAEEAKQVPFWLMLFVIEGCLHVEESQDYHAVTMCFRLQQLVSVISRRCSEEVGDVEERLEGPLSDQITPVGALSTLIRGDNGRTLKTIIREKQENVGVIMLPNCRGDDRMWTLRASEGEDQDVVLPSAGPDDWD
ncbi:hypothetical protein F5Y09DRAFT_336824 [Xylaria sp. FL1042]|nr:hypothetical protein F5Y09DRAFT_336824 [Xylaria sp. FL1042]